MAAIVLLRFIPGETAAAETQSPAPPFSPEDLASLWEAQRTEIATAEVRFRCCNGSIENPQNTPERVAQLLNKADLVNQPDSLIPFLLELVGKPFDVENPAPEMTLTVSGQRRRVDHPFSTFVTNGDLEAEYQPSNRQVTLSPPGKSRVHHYGIGDLRWIPPRGISAVNWRLLNVHDDVAVYDVPPRPDGTQFQIVTELDVATGIVAHSITRYPDGSPAVEMYQSGLEVHSSGIVFPKVRINLTYFEGVASLVRVMLIQSLRLNEPIDEAMFALPIPEKTVVVDFRTTEKSVYRETAAQADALALPVRNLDSPPRTTPVMSATGSTSQHWPILVAVHATVLLVLGVISLRRRRAARRQP